MEMSDLFRYTEQNPEAFAKAATFAEFAAALDGSKPGAGRVLQHIAERYPDSWENAFQTFKAHGFLSRPLALPHARKVGDILKGAKLYPSENGIFLDQMQYVRDGACYLSSLRAKGFAWSGNLGARYDWSPEWLKRGEKIRRMSGGTRYFTGGHPTEAVARLFSPSGDWSLGSLEAIEWQDGRQLIVGNHQHGIGGQWIALLDPGESALSLLSDHERGEIEAEEAAKRAAWEETGGES